MVTFLVCLDIALCFEVMKNLYESLRLKKLNVDTYILIKRTSYEEKLALSKN